MIAIPIDSTDINAKSSALFGNVKFFALYDSDESKLTFAQNTACGNGIKTAELLAKLNVTAAVYSYMGDGPFKTLIANNIDVYYIGKEPLALDEIIEKVQNNSFIKVDATNAKTYLDPGNATGSCECGCTHE
jgi:predicted Fe-Mo cluster-binding NifX family protein